MNDPNAPTGFRTGEVPEPIKDPRGIQVDSGSYAPGAKLLEAQAQKVTIRDLIKALQRQAGLPETGDLSEEVLGLVLTDAEPEQDTPETRARNFMGDKFRDIIIASRNFTDSEGRPYFIIGEEETERATEMFESMLVNCRNPDAK